ncbi:YjiH family protein [Ignatzschineria rhizosphaerae]|uniref:YjiH family protein n=1 Tax=Ignatzschineria rhizosphaerae TaxID=2923279 RepID=A0ABY3X6T6_9GAMM|nr:YjiH family protein [Ignatzschineria rhizosphaerae]UNM97172.1 YjiH family protein [Ignatzschineria rhizosphaerae]
MVNKVSVNANRENSSDNRFFLIKILLLSLVGIFAFFISIDIGGKETILLDHIAGFVINDLRPLAITAILLIMAYGAISPYVKGQYKTSLSELIFSIFKVLGFLLAILYLTKTAPSWAMQPDMLPFLFEKLALSVGLLIPIGAIALTFLIGFGLLEFVAVYMEKLMRPLFRTPGASAIDAVASFVGSYSIGLLITDRVFKQGKYSPREAVIVATGFSTVSATFMIIVAKTLDLMGSWNFFFWSTFLITFAVTTITVYLPPISGLDNIAKNPLPEAPKRGRFAHARALSIEKYQSNPPFLKLLWDNLKDGLRMSSVVAPSILAIGFTGLILSKYTPLFEWLGVVLKPILMLTGFENAQEHSGAIASGLAEMFLPAILLNETDLSIRYIAAVTSIGSVLFFSGSVPCILATSIPIKIWHILVIWFIRTALCLLLASLAYRIGIIMGWLG